MLDHSRQMPATDDEAIVIPDLSNGLIDRSIYSDPQLYRLELQRIFARAWNFMCHETQIPNAGDYFINYIGEDQVIAVRGEDGEVRVLLNTCRHRGNALCRAELGNTKTFVCSYHGWTYGLDGKLIGIPGKTDFYRDDVDQAQWGLAPAAKVDHYKGFYFATLDPAAPSLFDYLGDVGRVGIESMLNEGDVVALDGVQKNVIGCNWKIAVDNLFDWYHVKVSHNSASRVGFPEPAHDDAPNYSDGDAGRARARDRRPDGNAGAAGEARCLERRGTRAIDRLPGAERHEGDADRTPAASVPRQRKPRWGRSVCAPPGIPQTSFPISGSLLAACSSACACRAAPATPRSGGSRSCRRASLTPSGARPRNSSAMRSGRPASSSRTTGRTGARRRAATRGVVSRRYPQNLQMAMGQDEVLVDPSGQKRIETRVNEHAQRWTYRCWAEWMRARDWPELLATRSPSPTGRI